MTIPTPPDRDALAQLIRRSLGIADELGCAGVALALNTALERLTGEGVAPPA